MYPASFEYHRASTLRDAVALLTEHGDEAKLLAGGHSLLPLMKLRFATPAHLIDISRIPGLAGVTDGEAIRIGAMTRHAEVAASPVVRAKSAMLAEAAGQIGDPLVRNAGTIGGSLAHADPSADLPAVILAVGATLVAVGSAGERSIAADDFLVDVFQTALRPGEVLTAVVIPAAGKGTGGAYEKNPDPASGFAIVGVAAQVTVAGGKISSARVAVTGLGPKATRMRAVENALTGQPANAASVDAASNSAADGLNLQNDAKGTAAYKAQLARVYTKRAVTRALGRAGA